MIFALFMETDSGYSEWAMRCSYEECLIDCEQFEKEHGNQYYKSMGKFNSKEEARKFIVDEYCHVNRDYLI